MRSDVLNSNSNSQGEVAFADVAKMDVYTAFVTVADGATTGKESAIGMPANFVPLMIAVTAINASTNATNLVDVGDDGDTDGYVDGAALACGQSSGFKGILRCNGALISSENAADEVEVVVSADPGANTLKLKLDIIGFNAA
tara:strand:- start:342 stop:767 length:426 start_codon:yes stop_codon:yes gene_type:complete